MTEAGKPNKHICDFYDNIKYDTIFFLSIFDYIVISIIYLMSNLLFFLYF